MTMTCQNGWPVLPVGDPRLHTWAIPANNGDFRLTFRNGSLGLILAHCALRDSETVEDMTIFDSHHRLIVDDWGFAIRPVRGKTSGYSNHAGYAYDANATRHPLAKSGTYSRKQVGAIHASLRLYHTESGVAVVRWGGDYHGRKDEMHREINEGVTMADAEQVARRLMETPRGKRLLAANPGQRKVIMS